jgi:pimeloyl-ACP methyl ester carboxylesterase
MSTVTDSQTESAFRRSFARKVGRVMWIVAAVVLACILLIAGALLMMSPGRPRPMVEQDGSSVLGSLSEKIHVSINGVEQGMFIRSKDPANPVLLFVHGGPGVPEYWLTEKYPSRVEDYFTVCWWEQRGAGLSYSPDIPPETMTYEQFISDTLEVTNYLRHRFGKEKIYLMAHSGGSLFAIQAAARRPDLYHAYIGMGQMVYGLRSEQLAQEYMLARSKENGNTKAVRLLEANPVTLTNPLPPDYDAARDGLMHGLGIGTTRDMKSVEIGVFLASWFSRDYTLAEKINYWRGKFWSKSLMWKASMTTDLRQQITELKIPAYFLHGAYDYTVAYPLTQEFAARLEAPVKGFYTFDQSAHTPLFEEPEKVVKVLREDVLAGTNGLADKP